MRKRGVQKLYDALICEDRCKRRNRLTAIEADSFMAGHNYNKSQLSEMDHMQARNRPHCGHLALGQKPFVPPGSDAPIGAGSSTYGSIAMRSNDIPSSSYVTQYPAHRFGNPVNSDASFVHYPHPGSSSSYLPYDAPPAPPLSYPHRSEGHYTPISSQVDNRRVALKRKNPVVHPMDEISAGGYYAGSSSNPQFSTYMRRNSIPVPESCPPRMPLNMGPSHWNGHHLVNHEGSQRNVRGRLDHTSLPLDPSPAAAYASSSSHLPPFHLNASRPSPSRPVEWNQAPLHVPSRIVPPGTTGSISIALRERLHYPSPWSANSSVPPSTFHGPFDTAPFTHGDFASRPVHHDIIPSYPAAASADISSSRAVSHEAAILSCTPATSAATSLAARISQPFPAEAASSSRHPRQVSAEHGSSERSRRARNSYNDFHPLMTEDNNLGRWATDRLTRLEQLVIYESREAFDPHWDMRLDIDDMSYEELLALEERIGNVSTGLASEKISGCVTELICCSLDHIQTCQEDESCIICLEEHKDKDLLGRLKCGHDFHADCIKRWLHEKNSCPVCKAAAAEDTG